MTHSQSNTLAAVMLLVLSACNSQSASVNSTDTRRSETDHRPVDIQRGRIEAKPFAPRTQDGDVASPLFELLPAESTGIDFVNRLKEQNNVPYIYMGAGAAAGDYDNDGRVDLYLLSVDSPNRLYRQVAPWRFEDVTASAGGVDGGEAWSRGATFFDADNDGDLDLYVCNTEAPNLFYENQGNGTFRESAGKRGIDFVGASVMTGVADYDQDGDLDLYLLTHRTLHYTVKGRLLDELQIPADTQNSRTELAFDGEFRSVNGQVVPRATREWFRNLDHWEIAGQSDVLYRNNGDGTFSDVTALAGIGDDPGLGLSCTWLDFDRDGDLDLHVANDLQSKDRLYCNNGDGTFTERLADLLPHTTWFSMGSDFGDVNNDGRMDLLVVDMASTTHYRAKVQMGDMSRFRYFMEGERPAQLMRNSLFLDSGTEHFLEIASMAGLDATDWTWAAKLNDLDNDGWLDALFTNGIARADEMNPDLRKQREQALKSGGIDAMVRHIRQQPPDDTKNLAYRNTGQLRFEDVSHRWGIDHRGISYAAAQADFDNDGDLDLVVSNHNAPVSVYRNKESHGHRAIVRLHGRGSNRYGIGATVRLQTGAGWQIRQLFPTRGYMTCDEPVLHFGLGQQSRIETLTVEWPSGHRQRFDNLPVDHAFSITEPTVGNPDSPTRSAAPSLFTDVAEAQGLSFRHDEFAYDDYELQPLLPGKLSQLGPGLAWGDANGDGHDDLFVGGASGQSGALFVNQGDGHFKRQPGPWNEDRSAEDMSALWIDYDSDGDQDLIVGSGSSEFDSGDLRLRDRVYRNDGNANFLPAADDVLPDRIGSNGALVASDYDQDGDLDLFVGERLVPGEYPSTPVSQLLRNDNGRFVDVTDQRAPDLRQLGLVTSAVWTDVDQDHRLDLLVAVEWGPVRLYLNTPQGFVDHTQAAGLWERTGWWNSVAPGDVDGDGDIDFVALNAGLNTKYRQPSVAKPTLLLYGEMETGGTPQLIEVKTSDDGLLPVRGLSCSSSAMPFLHDRFSTYHEFASSRLDEIYDPACLERAQKLAANELSSGIWINDGNGHFDWQTLPFLAKNSPGYGATIADLDGDGHIDIYFVQNLFSREPETGVWGTGLSWMLQGDGSGQFEIVWPNQSGLVVTGDAKGLAVTDIDGDARPDIAVTQNNGELQLWHHRATPNARQLSIRLRGRNGNPTGVGARVIVRVGGRVIRTAEIYAGSGYLSQSSPIVFCGGIADGDHVDVDVIWPDGSTSSHVAGEQSQLTLQAP